MRLLILTQYYPPETGAPQNRLHELALRLKAKGVEVDVLTAMPNYPKMEIFPEYASGDIRQEDIDGIKVYRSSIFVRKSASIVLRLLNYFSFVFSSLFAGIFRLPRYDFIMVESPPLFLGISAWILCKVKGAKLIFNVSDLWPESAEKLGLVTNKLFLKMATWLEEFMYASSTLVTGQTQGIVADIKRRFPHKPVYWLPNGVDLSRYNPDEIQKGWRKKVGLEDTDLVFLYAGIIGHAQGLEVILKAANRLKAYPQLKFVLLGDGPEKTSLLRMAEELALKNVLFLDPVTKNEIPEIIKDVDASVVPLKKLPLFEGAIPSKIFELLAMKTPIILGVNGEAKQLFMDEGKAGLHFEPEDDSQLAGVIKEKIENNTDFEFLGNNGREYVARNFNRDKIAESLYLELMKLSK